MSQEKPIPAIAGSFRGVRMRSLLEVRWAVLFSAFQWRWDYEVITLERRIPDFLLHFARPTLLEVKPAATLAEVQRHRRELVAKAADWLCVDAEARLAELDAAPEPASRTARRAELLEIDELLGFIGAARERGDNASWERGRRALVAGSTLFPPTAPWFVRAGTTAPEGVRGARVDALTLDGVHLFARCHSCPAGVGLFNARGCLACGRDEAYPEPIPSADLLMAWSEAGNQSQWRPPTASEGGA